MVFFFSSSTLFLFIISYKIYQFFHHFPKLITNDNNIYKINLTNNEFRAIKSSNEMFLLLLILLIHLHLFFSNFIFKFVFFGAMSIDNFLSIYEFFIDLMNFFFVIGVTPLPIINSTSILN